MRSRPAPALAPRRPLAVAAAVATAVSMALSVALSSAPPAAASDPVGGPLMGRSGVVVQPGPDSDPLPDIAAASWVLADASGAVLAAKSAHLRRPPASTLKMLTAITVLPHLSPDTVYKAEYDDTAVEGSRVGLVEGADYTIDQLFLGMFLGSGNDAAWALARANGGVRHTVDEMNAMARRLQALDTDARNPSGLDAPGQVTSAYDLALIARHGLADARFAAYVATVSAKFPGGMPTRPGDPRPTYMIYNQNRLLVDGFEGAIGVKTGYTTQAGRTFVGAATRDGRTLIASFMGIEESTETTATTLLEWGFRNADTLSPVGTLVDPVEDPQPTTRATASGVPAAAAGDRGAAATSAPESTSTSSTPAAAVILATFGLVVGVALVAVGVLRARRRRRAA